MDFDFVSLLMLALFMLLPAGLFLAVYAIIFRRRGKFKRQRITGGSGRHHRHDETPADTHV